MYDLGDSTFDFKNPDYASIYKARSQRLSKIRAAQKSDPTTVPALKAFYKDNPARFISDWSCTFDPRNVERGLPGEFPFILFKRQEEWVEFIVDLWKKQQRGLTDKSRDGGLSWLSVALACTLCLHYEGMVVGFGSRKSEYVDMSTSAKSLFWKARYFMESLPPEFNGGWNKKRDSAYMRLIFPSTGSSISGEAGDNIGRGDRASIYFVDEAAWLEQPELVEAALSQTTNCRQDISTPRGMSNPFGRNRHSGKIPTFSFHWRDDPRKDIEWYNAKVIEIDDPAIVAQEIDISYTGGIDNVVIPSAWVQAAIDSHKKLGISISGSRTGALDVADQGRDTNCFAGAYGFLLETLEEWSGKDSDIFASVQRAMNICDDNGYASFKYDADGLGAGVRGDSRIINEARKRTLQRAVEVVPFWGSGPVINPDREDYAGRTNMDYFQNFKAQAWFSLRRKFQLTYRAVMNGEPIEHTDLISIDSTLPLLSKLTIELSQPTYSRNNNGKMVIDKTPDGTRSPNLADAVMMRYAAPGKGPMNVSTNALHTFRDTSAQARRNVGGINPDALKTFGGLRY